MALTCRLQAEFVNGPKAVKTFFEVAGLLTLPLAFAEAAVVGAAAQGGLAVARVAAPLVRFASLVGNEAASVAFIGQALQECASEITAKQGSGRLVTQCSANQSDWEKSQVQLTRQGSCAASLALAALPLIGTTAKKFMSGGASSPRVKTFENEVPPARRVSRLPSPKGPVGFTGFNFLNRGPSVTRESVTNAFRKTWPKAEKPGGRVAIALKRNRTPSGGSVLHLSERDTEAVEKWAEDVLREAQKAHPGQKLRIKSVDAGIGWNAGGSYIHKDNAGTYIHATSTLEGGSSTIAFSDSGVALLKSEVARVSKLQKQDIFPYVIGKNADGSLQIELRNGANVYGTFTLPANGYVQPKSGTTIIFSGLDHEIADPNVTPGTHASPLRTDAASPWDRVKFFVSIEGVG